MRVEPRAGASAGCPPARGALVALAALAGSLLAGSAPSQEAAYRRLRINEIIANNDTVEPRNCLCKHVDMVELYNPTDQAVRLYDQPPGGVARVLKLAEGSAVLEFQPGQQLLPRGRFLVFCDKAECQESAGCLDAPAQWLGEAHAPFKLDNDGETLQLLGPDDEIIDEVAFPPLAPDVSYGRYPDGAENWVFNSIGSTSFGVCNRPPLAGFPICPGSTNQKGSNVAPRIDLVDYSTNTPASGDSITLTAEVRDEKSPDAADLPSVAIVYRLDGGVLESEAAMALQSFTTDALNLQDRRSLWTGEIPGQIDGTVIDFYLRVRDIDGGVGISPDDLCEWPMGPCQKDENGLLPAGCLTVCHTPYQLIVGPRSQGTLVVNEVIPENQSVMEDPTETLLCTDGTNHCHFDDLLELYNASDLDQDLSGLVLAGKAFHAYEGWYFPAGSTIHARQHLVVWADGDGQPKSGILDPNDPARQEFHTNFTLNGRADDIYLFRPETRPGGKRLFHVLDGLRWGKLGEAISERDTFVPFGSSWRFFKGTLGDPPQQSSSLSSKILYPSILFDDTEWGQGKGGFGYGVTSIGTPLADMQGGYLTLFLRERFTVPDSLFEIVDPGPDEIIRRRKVKRLYLEVVYNDGFRAYLNGEEAAARNLLRPGYQNPAAADGPNGTAAREVLDITSLKDLLQKGSLANVLAVEAHNGSIDSGTFYFDARLFWGVEGLGDDESLGRVPDGNFEGKVAIVGGDLASPGSVNLVPGIKFRRGDGGAEPDGKTDISDAIGILGFLFLGAGAPACLDAADVDDSGTIDIGDGMNLLNFLFLSGALPAAPGPFQCGPDPTEDQLLSCSDPGCN